MPISDEKRPPHTVGKRPAWARGKFFQCSLVTSDVLWKAPSVEGKEENAEEVLAAFFYQVAVAGGSVNLGVQVVCESLTLYLVLEGMPRAFLALKQVCLAYGSVSDVAAIGDSGCVVWSDMSIQRILRYDRVHPNRVERTKLLRYARFVRYLGTPTFAELDSEEGVQSVGSSTLSTVGSDNEGTEETGVNRVAIIRDGAVLEYGGKTYNFNGAKRWGLVRALMAAKGEYVECGKGLKGYFAKHKEAKAFFDSAVEAEGLGRKGTGRYRLKI